MQAPRKLGSFLWLSSIQYFIFQIVVAAAWPHHYSWLHNSISDLGNTECGYFNGLAVCSPLHPLMNASFVLLGLTQIFGAIFLYRRWSRNRTAKLGFAAMITAGVGTILVGLFPENTVPMLHFAGAFLAFVIGNIGLIALGYGLRVPATMRACTAGLGVLALAGLILFTFHIYLGIGLGGMERVAAYPQTIWLISFGLCSLHK